MTSRVQVTRIARIRVIRGSYRGVEGWKIVGEDARGRRVSLWTPKESEVRRVAADIRAGKEPRFDTEIARDAERERCWNCMELEKWKEQHPCNCVGEQLKGKESGR